MIENEKNGNNKKGKFSYSKLNQYENCPYAYNLKYNEGHFYNVPSLAASFGTLVHKIEENISHLIMNGRPVNYEMLRKDFWNMNVPKRNKYDRDGDIFGANILKQRFPRDWYEFSKKTEKNFDIKADEYAATGILRQEAYLNEHPDLEIVGVEIGFEIEYHGYVFHGFIDRLLRHRGTNHFELMDLKTKEVPYSKTDIASPLQHFVYYLALKDKYGDDIIVDHFYDLPIANVLQPCMTKGGYARCEKKLDKLLEGIEAGDYHPSPSPLCAWCPFSPTSENQPEDAKLGHYCPYFSLWQSDNKTFEVNFEWQGPEKHEEIMRKYHEKVLLEEGESKKRIDISNFDFDF